MMKRVTSKILLCDIWRCCHPKKILSLLRVFCLHKRNLVNTIVLVGIKFESCLHYDQVSQTAQVMRTA